LTLYKSLLIVDVTTIMQFLKSNIANQNLASFPSVPLSLGIAFVVKCSGAGLTYFEGYYGS